MTTGNEPRAKRMIRSVLIIVYSLAIPLALIAGMELHFKHRSSGTLSAKKGIERAIRLREYPPGSIKIEEPDPVLLQASQNLIRRKYVLRIDENGFIMPSRTYDDPDLTVVFLGGSTTECMFVEEELRFPALTGEILSRESGLKVNSYNGGRSGNNSLHSINILMNKVIPLDPQIVVMMHNINDLVDLMLEKSYWNTHPRRSPVFTVRRAPTIGEAVRARVHDWIPHTMMAIGSLSSRGLAVHINKDEFADKRGTQITIDRKTMLHQFELNLRTFIELCRIRSITPVLMTQAHRLTENPDAFIMKLMLPMQRDYGIGYDDFKGLYDAFNDRIRAVGKMSGVAVIDLDRSVPKTGGYMHDLVHYHGEGSTYAAQVISRALLPLVRKKSPGTPHERPVTGRDL